MPTEETRESNQIETCCHRLRHSFRSRGRKVLSTEMRNSKSEIYVCTDRVNIMNPKYNTTLKYPGFNCPSFLKIIFLHREWNSDVKESLFLVVFFLFLRPKFAILLKKAVDIRRHFVFFLVPWDILGLTFSSIENQHLAVNNYWLSFNTFSLGTYWWR